MKKHKINKKRKVNSLNMNDFENEVVHKFNKSKRVKTTLNYFIKNNKFNFTPLANLCLIIAVAGKFKLDINQEELCSINRKWNLDPTIANTEQCILSDYERYLKQFGFKIPGVNTSMPLFFKSKKAVHFHGIEMVKRMTPKMIKQEIAERQPSLFGDRLIYS